MKTIMTKTRLYLVAKKHKRKNSKSVVILKDDGNYWGYIGNKYRVPLYSQENIYKLNGKLP